MDSITNISTPTPSSTTSPLSSQSSTLLSQAAQSSCPPSSLIIPISRTEIFPLPSPRTNPSANGTKNGGVKGEIDDNGMVNELMSIPFPVLPGEGMFDSCGLLDGGRLILTNYRLYIQLGEGEEYHVPLGLIESVEVKELFYLGIGCKDARSYRCTFDNNDQCLHWFGILLKASEPPRQLQELFAFSYYAWSKEIIDDLTIRLEDSRPPVYDEAAFMKEVHRLQFGSVWRISSANEEYKMCSSYPPKLLVPSNIQDDKLEAVAKFRSSRRIPAVVWRHVGNGAVIARCSQPEVGWLGWRSGDDEDLVKEILHACAMDAMPATALDTYSHSPAWSSDEDLGGGGGNGSCNGVAGGALKNGDISGSENGEREESKGEDGGKGTPQNGVGIRGSSALELKVNTEKKVLIMDARSYTTAVANRARGGGCECPEYYPSCEIQFMNLANIHSIRKSFHALRQLCTSAADQPNWFSLLEGTRWLLHQSGLMRAAVTLVTAIERDARPVLVHCSDGWDRTPQIVALAQLLLDPYYRTIDGFRILIEREWLAFGHKFADRCGHTTGSEDQNERCPVFLQWLDCVHQLLEQFPCSFEFSDTYLVKLVQHTYSNLFGTFLCNTKKDRDKELFNTFPVWTFLDSSQFRNYLYKSSSPILQVLWPQCNVRDLKLWSAVYLGSLETNKHDNTVLQQPANHLTSTQTQSDTTTSKPYNNNTKRTTTITTTTSAVPILVKRTSSTAVHRHVNSNDSTTMPLRQQNANNGNMMMKTRSYGDLMQMPSLIVKQCGGNNGLQARVGVGGGGCEREEERGVDGGEGGQIVREKSVRRLSDPSSVDIKILNLAMADHHQYPTADPSPPYTTFPHTFNNVAQTLPQTTSISTPNKSQNPHDALSQQNGTNSSSTLTSEDESDGGGGTSHDVIGDINHNDSCDDLTHCDDGCMEPTLPCVVLSLKSSCERLLLGGDRVDASTETLVATESYNPHTIQQRASPLNTSNQPTPTNNYRDSGQTDSRPVTYNCQSQNVNLITTANRQCHPATVNNKLTCSVCAQNKRFVTETNHFSSHSLNKNDEPIAVGTNNQPSNSSRIMQAAAPHQSVNLQQSNGQADYFTMNGYYGSGSSNVTSGVNTPTSLMTDDSLTAAMNITQSPAMLNGMTTSGYWGFPSSKMASNKTASLGDDGLVPLRLEMQERVATLIEENRREVVRLKLEVQKYRFALLQQLCHRCHHNDSDKYDETPSALAHPHASPSSLTAPSCHCPNSIPNAATTYYNNPSAYYDNSGNNMGGPNESATVASSLRSDHSWDNVDDMMVLDQQQLHGNPTLWMPDHAVNRCADCRVEFWIGRRRHHCRKCGQIFCAECSEHYATIPTEHLYTPVRVCRCCFTTLKQSNTDLCDDEEDADGRHPDIVEIGDGNGAILNGGIDTVEMISNNIMSPTTTTTTPTISNTATLPLHHRSNNNYIPRGTATSDLQLTHHNTKPPLYNTVPAPQPVQCCHHQHQQQQQAASSVAQQTNVGGGNAGVSEIAASSN